MNIRLSKIIIRICLVLMILVIIAGGATLWTENSAATAPQSNKTDLTAILQKETLSEKDYATLWEQTGLGRSHVNFLWDSPDRETIFLAEQSRFFGAPDFQCANLAVVSMAEVITDPNAAYPLYDLRPGDVLLTKSTHTLFWRHGHSALYLGNGEMLEATAIGKPTAVKEAALWGYYPSGIHLRVRDSAALDADMTAEELGESVAAYAADELADDRYRLFAGAFGIGPENDATQCAYLISAAYEHFGIQVSDRDFPVTPSSLLESGKFEILRFWGFDPKDLHW